ncbi:hypothetical protein BJ969_004748 [Saccharopolyspora gloriosae]|uniref:Uncharacterized protein n=1 Tax=Saccharopolyspora gloriosae TaxID=455344 RepID=A0A840NIH2_9PSEU|nr:hypothetical protein [Saccharopolyspora gloriosae]
MLRRRLEFRGRAWWWPDVPSMAVLCAHQLKVAGSNA